MTTETVLMVVTPILIFVALSVVVTMFTQALKKAMDVGIDKLRQSPSWPEILSMAQQAVRFAEQMKITGKVVDEAEVVKAAAIKALQGFLTTQGWGSLDLVALDALIEGAYNELKAELQYKVPEVKWSEIKDFTYAADDSAKFYDPKGSSATISTTLS